jgi:hypothetical protein
MDAASRGEYEVEEPLCEGCAQSTATLKSPTGWVLCEDCYSPSPLEEARRWADEQWADAMTRFAEAMMKGIVE